MDQESLRLYIQRRIRDGRLPHDGITKVWSSPSAGEKCDACEAIVSLEQLVMEGNTRAPGGRPFTFHVRCFQIWDSETRSASSQVRGASAEHPANATAGRSSW